MSFDLVIRDGLIVDGSGGEPYQGDVAVSNGVIAGVGELPDSAAREVIEASGCVVTPGFVDIHTHYDGQAIWSKSLTPSSLHGVTTVVMGNCGVGFAPCRPQDHALLVNAMEGVEDIPEVVMTEGLPWDWETFPEYLDALDKRTRDIDVAVFLPHSPLRVFAMGERGANREVATVHDIAQMAAMAAEAMDAGALGFATSRLDVHRRGDGNHIPTFQTNEAELQGIAAALDGRGIVQIATNITHEEGNEARRAEIELLARISHDARVPVTFSLVQENGAPERLDQILQWVSEANKGAGVTIHPQFAPRPVGVYVGHGLSANPFSACPSYRPLADLPLAQRLEQLRRPETRARITREAPDGEVLPIVLQARQFNRTFRVADPPMYEPDPTSSIECLAAVANTTVEELAYDLLLEDEGRAMLYVALTNYGSGNLDHVARMFGISDTVVGLGDGGAHYGMICDSSYPTFMLTYWTEERAKERLPLARAVQLLTAIPAELVGLRDRGRIVRGRKADLNVIDYSNLRLNTPEVTYDLPGGGRRVHQTATGYRRTFVGGQAILRDDKPTGDLPGHLVRGARSLMTDRPD